MHWYVALSLVVLAAGGRINAIPASDIPDIEHRLIGHPKERFPLTIYGEPAPSMSLNSAIQDAVTQWNVVFEQVFRRAAFSWTDNKAGADILFDSPRPRVSIMRWAKRRSTLISAGLFACP